MRSPNSDKLTAAGRLAFAFLWLFIASFPAEKAIEIPGLGTISKLLGLVALAAGAGAALIDSRIRVLSRGHALLALFVLWTAATFQWSLAPEETASRIQTSLQLLGMAWLIWEFSPGQERVYSLMRAYVFGTFYASADTIGRYLLSRQTYYQRYATAGFDPNDLALTLALSVPLSYCLAVRTKGPRACLYWLQMALAVLTVLFSASRAGFVACCIGAMLVPLTFRHLGRRHRLILTAGAVMAVAAALTVIPATSWKRLSTIGSEVSGGTLNSRSTIWKAGWQTFRQSPAVGVGAGAYPRGVEPMLGWPRTWVIVAHNTFFSVLVETGVIGFTLFLGFLAYLAATVWRMPGFDRAVWGVALLVWAVGVSTLTWEVRKPTWMLFALVLAAARSTRQPALGNAAPAARPARAFALREVAVP
jgi:O-antigen ligase